MLVIIKTLIGSTKLSGKLILYTLKSTNKIFFLYLKQINKEKYLF